MAERTIRNPEAERKPPSKIERRTESRTEIIAFKATAGEKEELMTACGGYGELSRYVRDCAFIGHSMKQAQTRLKATLV